MGQSYDGTDIGAMLRALRGTRSQLETALLCGVPQSTWSAWERRATAADGLPRHLPRVLDALGATLAQREELGRALVGVHVGVRQ